MTTYLLGSWCPNLRTTCYIPVGVVVREGEDVAVKVIEPSQLPRGYEPGDRLSEMSWTNVEDIFRMQDDFSNWPTSFYFTKLKLELEGSLEEKAEKFFEQYVAPSLAKQ